MKKSLLRLVVVLSLAGAAMAGPRTVPQGGRPSIFWDTAGWAGFNYVVDETGRQLKGTNTLFFKKNGNDWQIVVIHGAIDTFAGVH